MNKRTIVIVGGVAVLGFLYLRNRAAAVPATVNAGTVAPVGNTSTTAASTTNTQTVTGSEAGYVTTPNALVSEAYTAKPLQTVQSLYDGFLAKVRETGAAIGLGAVTQENGWGP